MASPERQTAQPRRLAAPDSGRVAAATGSTEGSADRAVREAIEVIVAIVASNATAGAIGDTEDAGVAVGGRVEEGAALPPLQAEINKRPRMRQSF
jgi:hypothetical protein